MGELKRYLAPRVGRAPSMDGSLTDPLWAIAPWTDDFVDIEGDLRPRPRFRTRAKMMWDADALYIGAEMEEPHLQASLTEHDSVIFRDNDFEVFIDPDGDNHLYGELEINSLNTTWDLLLPRPYRDRGSAINGWEIKGLRTAVHLRGTLNDPSDVDDGWSVEITLPWTALAEIAGRRCPPEDGDQWRINFSRVQWRWDVIDGRYVKPEGQQEDNWVWSPQGVVDMHQPERWGVLEFATDPARTVARPLDGEAEREALMRLYHQQVAFRSQHGRYAAADELDETSTSVTVTPGGYVATLGDYRVDETSRLVLLDPRASGG